MFFLYKPLKKTNAKNMKKFLILFQTFIYCVFCLFFVFCCKQPSNTCAADFYYTDNIHHLFTHCLLAFPEIAFDKQNNLRKHLLNDCITPQEFENILKQLYNNNFVLVDINTIYKVENDKVLKQKIQVPIGKKPLVFSFDDVVYDQKKMSKGMVDKIIIHNQDLATYTASSSGEYISDCNEFVPILENFVKDYPDFSLNGAKGTICLTGYDGILGYRTGSKNKINRQEEIQKVKPIIEKLKQNGWNFACHSFGHYKMKNISVENFEIEIKSWQNEVEPLIGKTSVYVYPYGEYEIEKDNQISPKHKLLTNAGFKLFCGVGMKQFFSYLPFNKNIKQKFLFMDRTCVDGFTLTNQQEKLMPYFDANSVIDKIRLV